LFNSLLLNGSEIAILCNVTVEQFITACMEATSEQQLQTPLSFYDLIPRKSHFANLFYFNNCLFYDCDECIYYPCSCVSL